MTRSGFCVIGAGSFGSALAIHLAKSGEPISLWGNKTEALDAMARLRCNHTHLPGIFFPENIRIEHSLQTALAEYDDILVTVPSHAFYDTLLQIKPHLRKNHRLIWGSKGLDPRQGKFLHVVAKEMLGNIPMAILSGPSFAKEVALGLPTAVVIAGNIKTFTNNMVRRFSSGRFRAYYSDDMIGVSLGGAMKNVLAIAVGISDGVGFGANARSALITRGLAEIVRLGVACGAASSTFLGLAGVGDLILTCTDEQSRNLRFGLALGRGSDKESAQRAIGQVIEGIGTAELIVKLGVAHGVDVPITQQVCNALQGKLSIQEAVKALFARELKAEQE